MITGTRGARAGSSPLTRGKLTSASTASSQARLIPAHAGKTLTGLSVVSSRRAHPRSRGENLAPSRPYGRPEGSSPLTRGKPLASLSGCEIERLIPAHAGKTIPCDAHLFNTPAHPRSRGENPVLPPTPATSRGSSPLTRGKPAAEETLNEGGGLIPAHAGKTAQRRLSRANSRAHPRSRGENRTRRQKPTTESGSSPLTRGKHPRRLATRSLHRLIPAHAGKTLPDLRFYCADRSDLGNP